MEYAALSGTDLVVSRIGLGMMPYGDPAWQGWVLDEAAGRGFVKQALDLGITLFDTADAYSTGLSEEILGRAIQSMGVRDRLVIATKCGLPCGPAPGGLAPPRIKAAAEASLRRLGVETIDLYQLHGWDPAVPIAETMGALQDLVQAGKIRHAGACNFAAWQLAVANRGASRLCTMQVQLNLLHREEEREMLPFCRYEGVSALAYSPLARGRLAGARTPAEQRRQATDAKGERLYGDVAFPVIDASAAVSAARGVPVARVALAWGLGSEAVAACVVGALEPGHLVEAARATTLRLEPGERAALEASYLPRWPALGDLSGTVQ